MSKSRFKSHWFNLVGDLWLSVHWMRGKFIAIELVRDNE